MILVKDAFATVWKVDIKEKYVDGRISTSEKDNREEGKWINSNWFVRFVGKAKEKAEHLQERDRITVLSGKLSNVYDKEKDKTYFNYVIFDFAMSEGKPASSSNNDEVDISDDEVPF